jgi:hypothetical protein
MLLMHTHIMAVTTASNLFINMLFNRNLGNETAFTLSQQQQRIWQLDSSAQQ